MSRLTDPPIPFLYNNPPDTDFYSRFGNPPDLETPLFIPFTRNHKMLEQTVLSYIAAGWPRSHIIVVENTGTMDANPKGLLSPENMFYLDYELLRKHYGVSILQTPTLLSFSQLQNFMISTAMSNGWKYYFWSHQDVVVVADETAVPFKGFYDNILESLSRVQDTMGPGAGENRWVVTFYSYDWLTLVNVDAVAEVGAWDTFIPYYASDCDWYKRIYMAGLRYVDEYAGLIYDMSTNIDEPETLLFGSRFEADANEPNSTRFQRLIEAIETVGHTIPQGEPVGHKDRGAWHDEINGGWGEPWTYNPVGLARAADATSNAGRIIFTVKWGLQSPQCDFSGQSRRQEDAWSYP
ncbi:hypothetical protein TWF730_001473 [Orbilia blumenaviensis]|uniref:Uncharacterized protein n=1 Tax=Orbilia blumenaviensis TaxID=1796055 RepID=A0AAV9UL64_9PEZI